ncbi:MAG: T9SS type A sorting domain-containing protein, partial [Prolixibacteraceae bacterium]|nr:T9SS type A sorting domain-containing protein [Prolixibacteraceae bacterium]
ACANSDELLNDPDWTTDRAFVVPDTDTLITNVWASCQSLNAVSALKQPQGIRIYPNWVTGNTIFVESLNIECIEDIYLLSVTGNKLPFSSIRKQGSGLFQIDLHEPKKGVYFLQAIVNNRVFSEKFIIE